MENAGADFGELESIGVHKQIIPCWGGRSRDRDGTLVSDHYSSGPLGLFKVNQLSERAWRSTEVERFTVA